MAKSMAIFCAQRVSSAERVANGYILIMFPKKLTLDWVAARLLEEYALSVANSTRIN